MAPATTAQVLLSPAELSYLHSSLAQTPPIRPDGRTPTQFRPLVAESNVLPGANGSARICFSDGTEAIVGVKAEVEKSGWKLSSLAESLRPTASNVEEDEDGETKGMGENDWVEMSVEIPGFRDDDQLPVFLAAMLTEALLARGGLKDRLWINARFHWKLYVDILLLSPPLSYPLPLLSLTTHLALLSARLPRLISEGDEDPLFSDDWDASTFLYPQEPHSIHTSNKHIDRPPVTLLVIGVGNNIFFDPSKEEVSVADAAFAISISETQKNQASSGLDLVSIRSVDLPARVTPSGIPNALNPATGGVAPTSAHEMISARETSEISGVWMPPRGGMKRSLIGSVVRMVIDESGVGKEVLQGLREVER